MATALLKDFLKEETSVPRKGPYTAEEDAAIVEYVTRKVAEYMRERKPSSRRRLSLKGDKFWKLAAVELRAAGTVDRPWQGLKEHWKKVLQPELMQS
ncbi:hypothetical protein FOZ60_010109 [Perkinsus olseni]|uniref:Uncharacterized protein n=1 Tax=Perkinsus olseni TaxID=32597 RepID=A0A7J6NFV2_PEROL|nr:hypothetical protein FOZ60_010109 [Perkinsus olseni]